MTDRYSIAEARRNLPRLVHEVKRGKGLELIDEARWPVAKTKVNLDLDPDTPAPRDEVRTGAS